MKRQNPRQLPSGAWQIDFHDINKKRTRKTFRTKDAADRALRRAKDARDRGELPKPPTPTLRDFFEGEGGATIKQRVETMTWDGYERSMKLHVLPYLGDEVISRIDLVMLQRWITDLGSRKGAPTVHRSFAALSAVMKVGETLGFCLAPSKRKLSMARERAERMPVPSYEDVERLADEIDPRYRAMILVAGFMGLRQGELFALHPSAVDFSASKIYVRQTLDRTGTRVDRTKNHRDRAVTLPVSVSAALRAHMEEYPSPEWVFHRGGRPLDHSWFFHQVWKDARENAGIDCRFHSLRHAAVSVMAYVWKWGPKRVQLELGHSSAGFTLDRYGHHWSEGDDGELERMDQALRSATRSARVRRDDSENSEDFKPGGRFERPAARLQIWGDSPDLDIRDLIDYDWNRDG